MALPGGEDFIPESPWTTLFIVTALGGSFMVSYTKARAEGLGVRCEIGWMQRPERMTLLIIGSLLGSLPSIGLALMKWTLLLFAILTVFTAIQRIVYVKNQLSGRNNST
jgi:CDP-diacylglycerol--glycerol-3-phosphate 3-phosphatidyltransferase